MITEIKVLVSDFEKNPETSIKSILGNDINIISYKKNDFIIGQYYIIYVEYDAVDIDLFKVYEVKECKKLNTNSDIYITEIEGKLVKLINDGKKKNFFIRVYAAKKDINGLTYYGTEIKQQSDLLHSFCSIFGTQLYSYHGTSIKSDLKSNITFEKALKKSIGKLDTKKETEMYLTFQSIGNDYVNSFYDISYFKTCDDNELKITESLDNCEQDIPYLLDLKKFTPETLKKELKKNNDGLILMLNTRVNPLCCVYTRTPDYRMNDNIIDCFIVTLSKDVELMNQVYPK